jgi:hypothetical protein
LTIVAFFYFIAYTSQQYNYNLLILLIWYLIYSFWAYSEFPAMMTWASGYYITIYYLTLRFKQISLQLKQIQNKNFIYLLELIASHNMLTICTEKYNILFSFALFVMYVIGIIGINLMIYLSIYGNLHIILRFLIISISIFDSIFLFSLTYTSAMLTTEAHKVYNTINSIFVRYKLPLIIKLKVFTIIQVF